MNLLYDFLTGVWALRWVLLGCVVLVAAGTWWDQVDVRRRLRLTAGPDTQVVHVDATPPPAPTPTWWFVDGGRKSYSGATAATAVVHLEVDPDTAVDLAKAWEAYHRSDVTRDVFRPTWSAEYDALVFESIQARHAHVEPQSPRRIDLGSDPPDHFPVYVHPSSTTGGLTRLDVTHRTIPTSQENQS